jgi:hypothetical protein
LEALNPHTLYKDEISTTKIISIPSYLPFEGMSIYNDKYYTCNGTTALQKRTKLGASLRFPILDNRIQDLWQRNLPPQVREF